MLHFMSHHKQVAAMYFGGFALFFFITVTARHAQWIKPKRLRQSMPLLALPLAVLWPLIFVVMFVAMVGDAMMEDVRASRDRKQDESDNQPSEPVPKQVTPDADEQPETSCTS
jgi:hypothetical protein